MLNVNANYVNEKNKLLRLLNSAIRNCRENVKSLLEWRDSGVVLDELYTERTKQEYIKTKLEFWKQEELNVTRLYKQALSELDKKYSVA